MLDPLGCGLSDKDVARKMAVSQEIYALTNWKYVILAKDQREPFCKEKLYFLSHSAQELLVLVEQDKVIAIPDIVPNPHFVLKELV